MSQEYKTITLAAGGVANVPSQGSVFHCISATGAFTVQPDNQRAVGISSGRGFGSPSQAPWNRLTFQDTSGAPNTITFYSGMSEFKSDVVVSNTIITSMANSLAECIEASPDQFVKTVAAAGTAEALKAASYFVRKAIVYAFKTAARGANTGEVYLGASGTGANQPILLSPGQEYVIEPSVGNKTDLAGWYLNAANNGDGVVVIRIA